MSFLFIVFEANECLLRHIEKIKGYSDGRILLIMSVINGTRVNYFLFIGCFSGQITTFFSSIKLFLGSNR